jgi:hypothetical protein
MDEWIIGLQEVTGLAARWWVQNAFHVLGK